MDGKHWHPVVNKVATIWLNGRWVVMQLLTKCCSFLPHHVSVALAHSSLNRYNPGHSDRDWNIDIDPWTKTSHLDITWAPWKGDGPWAGCRLGQYLFLCCTIKKWVAGFCSGFVKLKMLQQNAATKSVSPQSTFSNAFLWKSAFLSKFHRC